MFYPVTMTITKGWVRRGLGMALGAATMPTILCLPGMVMADAPDSSRFEILVLGVAQDGGVPHLGCDKNCCATFRADGRRLFPTSLGIHDRKTGKLLLVEATPAVEDQVALLQRLTATGGRGRKPVDGILLTHAHIGHYLGLAQLGSEVTSTTNLPVYVSLRMAEFLRTNGPWNQLIEREQIEIRVIEPGKVFQPMEGLSVLPIAVPHRDEYSDTMAFKFLGEKGHVLFVPDVDSWVRHPELLPLLLEDTKLAYLDATFYDGRELPDRDLSEIPHPLMVDTMIRLKQWAEDNPHRLQFIHLNHTNPALHDHKIQKDVMGQGFCIAERGDRVGF